MFLDGSNFFLFFQNEKGKSQLLDQEHCITNLLKTYDINLFANNFFLEIIMFNSLSKPVCPIVFKNAAINQITVKSQSNNLIRRHILKFLEMKAPGNETIDLNCQIRHLTFTLMYRINIDEDFLSHLIYARTAMFKFDGTFSHISPDVFKPLINLRQLEISLNNTREFFHSSDNKWLQHVFSQGVAFETKLEIEEHTKPYNQIFTLTLIDFSLWYDFPEEYFCLQILSS